MVTLRRSVRILLAAGVLALLSGCVVAVSGGRPHHHGSHFHHFYDDGPRWKHASPWHWRQRHFHGPRHHWPRHRHWRHRG